MNNALDSYDQVPYTSWAFAQTHPDRLATLARLFGLPAADPHACRVLELGCASGGNLLPMALVLPNSEFVGIDLSARQISVARERQRFCGLKNVRFEHVSILDFDERWGDFDYIICHGVYSWVSENVQEKILKICHDYLRKTGVAYISYNTYPGWRMRGMLRDMMLYHAGSLANPEEKVTQARALIEFLARNASADDAYGRLLHQETSMLAVQPDYYLLHDHLESCNKPVYFYEFIDCASKNNLQYLSEAQFSTMLHTGLSQEVEKTLDRIAPDILRKEQYLDFIRNRMFRQTLLVHKAHTLKRSLNWQSVCNFFVSSCANCERVTSDLNTSDPVTFIAPNGGKLITGVPITKAAMRILTEKWPKRFTLSNLASLARGVLDPLMLAHDAQLHSEDLRQIAHDCLTAYSVDVVNLSCTPGEFVSQPSLYPQASPYACLQVLDGRRVTSLIHVQIDLDELSREILKRLDGTRDKAALADELVELLCVGALNVHQDGELVTDVDRLRNLAPDLVVQVLQRLADNALLVA